MCTGTWLRALARHRFAVAPSRLHVALLISAASLLNTGLWAVQRVAYGRRIRATSINHPPVFIVGHWRSGTTLLHEYLVRDPRHTSPNTYQCFAPNHFLVSRRFLPPLVGFLLPERRPMDNMLTGWDRPQEDEFALCAMGVPSPYLKILFPQHDPTCQDYLDFQGCDPAAVARWKEQLLHFLRAVTLRDPRRIVLKSPPHTARLGVLRELFPEARFIHMVREPCVVFASTLHLWRRLYRVMGLQPPPRDGLEEYVLSTFERMYAAFDRQRPLVPPGRLAEVRYEDLVARPLEELERVYEELALGPLDDARPALAEFAAAQADYRTNRYELTPELRAAVQRRWAAFVRRYGYD